MKQARVQLDTGLGSSPIRTVANVKSHHAEARLAPESFGAASAELFNEP